MGWAVGYDTKWHRDIGYGVPATCDHPGCGAGIDRGLSYVCGSEPFGGEHGCGLYFCARHMGPRKPRGSDKYVDNCLRCQSYRKPYSPTPDTAEWINHKLTHSTWQQWRDENPAEVARLADLAAEVTA